MRGRLFKKRNDPSREYDKKKQEKVIRTKKKIIGKENVLITKKRKIN